ncbi:MAG: ABC transporter ATP-binding protein [Chitinophagales bacterium]
MPQIPLLQIRDLSVEFKTGQFTIPAVNRLSFDVQQGETVAIVGESGSGKSVTSLSILQLLPPSATIRSGEILFSSEGTAAIDLLSQSGKQMRLIRGSRIGMIFQEPMTSLNPLITCGQQVVESLQFHEGLNYRRALERTITLFEKVKLPRARALFRTYPHQLSGGQKQRVMIAMAISCKPSLLICDEPTTALDSLVQHTILQLLMELQKTEKMGILFITHDLGVVAEIADRAIVLRKGRIQEEGFVRNMFRNPQSPYTRGLLNCRPILHKKGERLPVISDFVEDSEEDAPLTTGEVYPKVKSVTESVIYSDLPKLPFSNTRENIVQQALLSVQNLNVWFPIRKSIFGRSLEYTKAVKDVSFSLYKGETLGIVGESGCGKTTLGRTLLRLIEPHSGKIIFNGLDLRRQSHAEMKKLRKEIQIVFQDPYSSLNPRLTIGAAIAEPLRVHGLENSSHERRSRVNKLLERTNLHPSLFYRYPHEFSGGQRQRIVIARALIMEPSFVVFDESVSALDVSVQAQILNLINDLKREFGFTVIFISHDLSVIRYLSDRILVMNQGKIEEIGPAEKIYTHPKTPYTKKLIEAIPKGMI